MAAKKTGGFGRFVLIIFVFTLVCAGLSTLFTTMAKKGDGGFPAALFAKLENRLNETEKVEQTVEFPAALTAVEVKAEEGDVEIVSGDGDQIKVMFTANVPKDKKDQVFGTKTEDGALKVRLAAVSKSFIFHMKIDDETEVDNRSSPHVTIEVPKTWKGAVEAKTVAGTIQLKGVSATGAVLESVSGSIEAYALKTPKTKLKSVSGTIDFSDSATDELEAKTVSGEINIQSGARGIEARSVSGDVNIALEKGLLYEFDLGSTSGKITNQSSMGATAKTKAASHGNVKARTVSGDLLISRADPSEEDRE